MNRTLFYNELPVYVVPNSTVKDSKSRILTKFFELKTNERLPKIMDVLSRSTLRQFDILDLLNNIFALFHYANYY